MYSTNVVGLSILLATPTIYVFFLVGIEYNCTGRQGKGAHFVRTAGTEKFIQNVEYTSFERR